MKISLIPLLSLFLISTPLLTAETTFKANFSSYSISPTLLHFRNSKQVQWLTIQNNSENTQPLAVEFSLYERQALLERREKKGGQVDLDLLDEDKTPFTITPSKIILFPGESQMVEVRLLTEYMPTKEQAFSLICKQILLPNLELEKLAEDHQLHMVVSGRINYECILYVLPPNAHPKVTITQFACITSDDGGETLQFELFNTGSAKQMLADGFTLQFDYDSNKKHRMKVTPAMIEGSLNAIYPDCKRLIVLPWPEGLTKKITDLHIECKK